MSIPVTRSRYKTVLLTYRSAMNSKPRVYMGVTSIFLSPKKIYIQSLSGDINMLREDVSDFKVRPEEF